MISFIPFKNNRIIGIRISGKVSDTEYDEILKRVDDNLNTHAKLNLYIELEDFEGTSLENYFKDFKFGINNWNRFDKTAVVTEKEWVRKLAPITDKIFPNIKMKAFPVQEQLLAKEWVQKP